MNRRHPAAVLSLLTAVLLSFTVSAAEIESAELTDALKPVKVVEVTEKASAEAVPASSQKSTLLGSAQDADYFCITNVSEEGATVEWSLCSDSDGRGGTEPQKTSIAVTNSVDLEYSFDKETWTSYEDEIELPAGQSVYFRNDTGTFSASVRDYCSVACDTEHTVSGDITTLLKYSGNVACLQPDLTDRDPADELNYPPVFYNLFADDAELISAKDLLLPSMTLSKSCYSGMFNGCEKLKDAPELPAVILTESCCDVMFAGCTALAEAPALPADTLAPYCYNQMFEDCENLASAPDLPAETLAEGCCSEMFSGCTALAKAPELPALTLAQECYKMMFSDCAALTDVTMLAEDISAQDCLNGWLEDAASAGTVIKAASTDLEEYLPEGWLTVGLSSDGPGKLSAKKDGATVTLSAVPDSGYKLQSLTVKTDEGGEEITVTDSSFTMPEESVTVTAVFAEPEPHVHSFTVKASGSRLTASCTEGCTKGYDTEPLTLTLIYDGEAHFENSGTAAWEKEVGTLPEIIYYLSDGTTKTTAANSGAAGPGKLPVKSGSYIAKAGEAKIGFTITLKVSLSLSADVNGSTVIFTARFRNAEDGTYEMTETLDGKPVASAKLTVRNGIASWTEKGFAAGKHTVKITAAGASAQAVFEIQKKTDPIPAPVPVHDNVDYVSEPLFTGTWNNPVSNGTWSKDANGVWYYRTSEPFRNTWACIVNPYAGAGQNASDWFWFDAKGCMLTGWQLIGGKWYYLNPNKDGTLGACLLGPGKTPDGYEIDASGAWTGR